MYNLCDVDRKAKLKFVNWYFQGVYAVEIDSTFVLFKDTAVFILVDT